MSGALEIAVGIDVGGTKVLAGALRPTGELVAEARVATPGSPEELLPSLREVMSVLLGEIPEEASIAGLGIALPGLVDRAGVLHTTPNLGASERGLNLHAAFGEELIAVVVARSGVSGTKPALALENDGNCAAFAEHACGAGSHSSDVIVVSLGTGIGGGVIADGRLLRGWRSFAGEIGHMVVEQDGEPCPCGRRGCWERYASGSGLAVLGRRAVAADQPTSGRLIELAGSVEQLSGENVTEAARGGDPLALQVLEEFAGWLGLGFANLVELYDPESIVIGGGLVREADLFLEHTRAAYESSCRSAQHRTGDDLVVAALGEYAACIGAGLLSLGATR